MELAEQLWGALLALEGVKKELRRLEAQERAVDECFCRMVGAVVGPLQGMVRVLERLDEGRPEELEGCRHAIEEWRGDLAGVLEEVGRCLMRAAGVVNRPGGGVEKAVEVLGVLGRMRLLRAGFVRLVFLLVWKRGC